MNIQVSLTLLVPIVITIAVWVWVWTRPSGGDWDFSGLFYGPAALSITLGVWLIYFILKAYGVPV